MKNKKLNIAIDFDGTITITKKLKNGSWKTYGMRKDANKYINKLHEDGHYIILWTCREGENLSFAEKFCKDHNIWIDRVNANPPEHMDIWKLDSRKICVDLYVDDMGILGIPSWKKIYDLISKKAKEN